jgi:hypothetical protein
MIKQINFHIVRYYINDQIQFITELTPIQAKPYQDYLDFIAPNEEGGETVWYRINIVPPTN